MDTRRDRDLLIIARTDAIAPEGFEAAIERAAAYHDAGADVTFVEAPTTMEQIADIPRRLPWPQLANIVLGGRTPELPNEKLKELGYAGVIYANVALQAAVKGMQAALRRTQAQGTSWAKPSAWWPISPSGSGWCTRMTTTPSSANMSPSADRRSSTRAWRRAA